MLISLTVGLYLTNVAHDCTLYRCFVFLPTLICLHLKFIQLSWKRIIHEQICSLEWLVLFLLCCAPLMEICRDRLSESPFLYLPLGQNTSYKKLAVFEKQEYNYRFITDIIIIPAQNTHCPISPKLLVDFCVYVVFVYLKQGFHVLP